MDDFVQKLDTLGEVVNARLTAVEETAASALEASKSPRQALYQDEIDREVKNAYFEAAIRKATHFQPGNLTPTADEVRATKAFGKVEKAGLSTADANYFSATTSNVLVADIVEKSWLNEIPRVNVRGSSIKVPVLSSATGVVLLDENTGDTAQIAAAGTAGTRSITLDPPTLAIRIPITKQATQDSYLDLMPVMVEQAVRALRDALQFVAINGDTAGTFDGDSYASNDKRKAFDGFRKLAYTSGKVDAATFGVDKLFDTMALMGAYGEAPRLLALASHGAYYAAAEKITALYTSQADFTTGSGSIPRFLGAAWVPTALVPLTHTDGKVNATPGNNVKNSVVLVDPDSFILGVSQDIQLELEYSAVGQVYNMVVTARIALGKTGAGQACGLAYGIA